MVGRKRKPAKRTSKTGSKSWEKTAKFLAKIPILAWAFMPYNYYRSVPRMTGRVFKHALREKGKGGPRAAFKKEREGGGGIMTREKFSSSDR